jgi:eukaryotic-like serine/threonine-protein kinase
VIDIGSRVGNYQIKSKLGEGGMGIVFYAEHPLIGRRVAIKVIHPNYARNPEAVSRFFTEAQAVNRIGHPNIVDITDFGQTPEEDSYFVMEYLQGEALAARLRRGRMSLYDALYIGAQIADALAASHSVGILHRDLKPDNVFLVQRGGGGDHNFVKVLDFGLAKLTGGDEKVMHKTRTGSVMGTPYYMAPEQCLGKADIDARADIYALGVMLFEMCVGRVPFGGDGYGEVIVKHMTEAPPLARQIDPTCPDWLEGLIARCLVKERTQRIQTMAELRDILVQGLQTVPQVDGAGPRMPSMHPMMASRPPGSITPLPGSVQLPGSVPPAMQSRPPQMGSQPPRSISTLGGSAAETAARTVPPKRRGTSIVLGGVVAGVAIGGVVIAVLLGGKSKGKPAETPAAAASVDAAPIAKATPPDAAPPAVRPPEATTVTIHIESEPPGATIKLGDKVLGVTPFDWVTEKSAKALEVELSKDGFLAKKQAITPSAASNIAVALATKTGGGKTGGGKTGGGKTGGGKTGGGKTGGGTTGGGDDTGLIEPKIN